MTWMAGGYGRAQGSYDEMVFRAKVLDSMRFYGRIDNLLNAEYQELFGYGTPDRSAYGGVRTRF